MDPLKIVKLEAENVKRLVAVEIEPDGSLVVIGGKNGAGKTSVLDSIAYALGGREALCEEPLRKGAQKGHVTVDLGEFVVTRTFTPDGGGTLKVSAPNGAVYPSPQAMLDKLLGKLSFDPLGFARMKPTEQRETLRSLVGLDFSALDAARAQKFAERTDANREAKKLEARLAAMPLHKDAPSEPVSVAAIAAELEVAQRSHDAAFQAERRRAEAVAAADREIDALKALDAEIARLQREHAAAHKRCVTANAAAQEATILAASAQADSIDSRPIRQRLAEAEGVNERVRANVERVRLAAILKAAQQDAEALTSAIEALDADKAQQLAAAEFPVAGLEFDEAGVRLAGIPFAQASAAEQLRVSVAMGLAMNPRLRVVLIRDGSLLDDDSLALVATMAAEAEAQVWMERVGEGAECSVVIVDGAVRGANGEVKP